MDELNKAETVARFRGTEMEVVRYLADLMLSPGRGVQALNDDLDFAFLLLRQMEADREAGTINQACKTLGTLSLSDACVAQQRYSDMARWLTALARRADEVSRAVCVLNASGTQGPIFQTQRPGSAAQDAFRSRSSSAQREARTHGAYSQENSNRLRAGAPSYIPPSNPIFISHRHPSGSRSSERADTTTTLHSGEVAIAQPPLSTLGVPPPRARTRTSSCLERLARAKIAAVDNAGDGNASQQPSPAILKGIPFVPTSRAGSRPRTSSSLERLATAKIAAIERSSNAIHCDTQAPMSNNLLAPQMTAPSNYSQSSPKGLLLSGFADSSPRGRTIGRAVSAYNNAVYQDTTSPESELTPPTCYLRWSNFNYGKPSYLPFSTVRSATVRIAHSVPGVNITGLLDVRDTNGDLFLRFDNPIEAEDYAEYVRSYPELLGAHSTIVPASVEEYRVAERVASARWPDRRPAMEVFGGGLVPPSGPAAAPTFAVTAPSPPHDTWSESSHSVGGSTLVTPSPSPSMQGSDIPDQLCSPLSRKESAEEGALRDGTDGDGDNENGSAVNRPRGCRGGVRVRKRKENRRLKQEQEQVQEKHDHHTRQRIREELAQAQEIQDNELRLWGLRL